MRSSFLSIFVHTINVLILALLAPFGAYQKPEMTANDAFFDATLISFQIPTHFRTPWPQLVCLT